MQKFKIKNTKKVDKDKRVTIDAKHKSVIKDIDLNNNNIKKINKQIITLKNEQKKYTKKDNKYHSIEDEIIELKNNIKELNYNKNDYFIDNGRTLYSYYKASSDRCIKSNKSSTNSISELKIGNVSSIDNTNSNYNSNTTSKHQDIKDLISLNKNNKNNISNKGIFFYLNATENTKNYKNTQNDNKTSKSYNMSNLDNTGNSDNINNLSNDSTRINNIENAKKELNNIHFDDQTSIIRSYMNNITPTKYVVSNDNIPENNMSVCKDCNAEYILSEMQEYYVCPKCGQIKNNVLDSDVPSTVKTSEVSTFSYQRLHHFKDCLAQFQAKESTNIPQDIIDKIKAELTKYRITDYNRLTPKLLRNFLKKLKLSSYYEHIPHIIYRISGRPAPKIPAHVEERLLKMFLQAEEIFMELLSNNTLARLGIKNRKNIMRYTFMFYKLFELEGMNEFLDYLILLKCRKKLYKQDQIWKEICMRAGWQFKPTDWARI